MGGHRKQSSGLFDPTVFAAAKKNPSTPTTARTQQTLINTMFIGVFLYRFVSLIFAKKRLIRTLYEHFTAKKIICSDLQCLFQLFNFVMHVQFRGHFHVFVAH